MVNQPVADHIPEDKNPRQREQRRQQIEVGVAHAFDHAARRCAGAFTSAQALAQAFEIWNGRWRKTDLLHRATPIQDVPNVPTSLRTT